MVTASIKNLIILLLVSELASFNIGSYARNIFTVINYKNKSHAYGACFLSQN